jgi:hypothetical protein
MSGIIPSFIFQISLLCLSIITFGYASPAMAEPVPVAWLGIENMTSNFTKKYQANGSGLAQIAKDEPPIFVSMEYFIAPSREVAFRGKRYNEITGHVKIVVDKDTSESKTFQLRTLGDNAQAFDIDLDNGEFTIYDYYVRVPFSMKIGERIPSAMARSYQNDSVEKLVSIQISEYSLKEINTKLGKFEFCETTREMKPEHNYVVGKIMEDCLIFDRENHINSFVMRVEDREDGTRFEVAGKIEITD